VEKILTSYSMWRVFANCRKKAYWRYIRNLVPITRDKNLDFGTVIHSALDLWHGGVGIAAVRSFLRAEYGRAVAGRNPLDYAKALAMVDGYARRYPEGSEPFKVVALERVFRGDIHNPATGACSRKLDLGGKVDGLVQTQDGRYWLLEHKTATNPDGSYLENLWTDFQITLYSYYVQKLFGVNLSGVLYNILAKNKLQQRAGETEAEYQIRYADLCSKNKSGKSTATRNMPETDDEFAARLATWHGDSGAYIRQEILISQDRFTLVAGELWELTQTFLDCRRRGAWFQNPGQCFGKFGQKCEYFALCSSGDSPVVMGNQYCHQDPHEELRESLGIAENNPFLNDAAGAVVDLADDALFADELAALDGAIPNNGGGDTAAALTF